MNGNQRGDLLVAGTTSEDYSLLLRAIEIVEISRCMPDEEARALVVDLLKDLLKTKGRAAKRVSGCHSSVGECPHCKDETRLFSKPSGGLTCGACAMDELLAFMHSA